MASLRTDSNGRISTTFRFKEENASPLVFFSFPRRIVTEAQWKNWPSSACAILPALLAFRDHVTGHSWPSIDTLARVCGLDRKTASRGIEFLCEQKYYQIRYSKKPTPQGRWKYDFYLPTLCNARGMQFPFRQCVIMSGNWCILNPLGKRLYCVLRSYAQADACYEHDMGECSDNEEDDPIFPIGPDKELFARRSKEFCVAEQSLLMQYAGIQDERSYRSALASLSESGLAEPKGPDAFEVRLTPTKFFAKALNDSIDQQAQEDAEARAQKIPPFLVTSKKYL